MKRVLLITRNAWNESNSTGSTASNLFVDFQESNLANIYCRNESINNNLCKRYFKITEKSIIKSIINRTTAGDCVELNPYIKAEGLKNSNSSMAFFRKYRFILFLWIRELIWCSNRWKNKKLDNFIRSFNPEVIYMPLFDSFYMYKILFYVYKQSNAKIVLFTGDDVYSLKQASASPLYWINRFILRHYVKKAVNLSSLRYCLTEKQKKEYESYFGRKFIQITKYTEKVTEKTQCSKKSHSYKTISYFGNLNMGRYDTLYKIGKIIDREGLNFKFKIYCNSELTEGQFKKIRKIRSIEIFKPVPPSELKELQCQSDYLLHLEAFTLKEKLQTRLSFSTKITEYLGSGVPIIAIGWKKSAAMEFLAKKRVAYTINNLDDLIDTLTNLKKDEEYVNHALNLIETEFNKERVTKLFTNKICDLG